MVVNTLILATACSILAVTSAGKHDVYSGYTVHGIKVNDRNDQELLFKLVDSLNIDIWDHGVPALRDALAMVGTERKDEFLKQLDLGNISHYLHLEDVSRTLKEHDLEVSYWRRSKRGRIHPFEDFPRYAEVNAYLERIASQYPDIVTLVNSGPSFEGRDIKYLKISTTNFTDVSKPIYFMNAMLHAREWVTTPVALYSIHRLVEEIRSQDRDLLDNIDWIIMPLANPDGYEYSHTHERLWRRTRSFNPSVSTTCYGVDANRNFNVSHNTLGVSSDPCSNVYPGHVPFSEVETGYIRDVLLEYVERIQLYVDIHSHGNYILFGYGDTSLPLNVLHVHYVGAVMGAAIDALKLPEARYYMVGNSALVLYVSSGSAQDYGQLVGVPFSYTLELPGYGQAFTVHPRYIDQINEETWHGIAASARVSLIHYKARFNN
ncbi:unnamed protein product [Parnassius mnemosyne]|uniref:Peptidase M14 domain-containing protein n=1 Tax=Parnassius mnemosyne TaxID=213953 RepID=A0AAV1L5U5_9NEOP